ncbi:DUF6382 domain-containing protein [Paenibacillus sp. P46E]|uniref:DUF6382 domain-containing protein n=1 Tax=Paenibacillus sp. P46E TaxID=1349436 RepID=UPI00093A6847|nr:DUF6382 domain-containing protein [Paenibacillus sp. P46E]OKP97442.1 hypothetical protein A3849_16385 [Paenibacillus sp. P46E]
MFGLSRDFVQQDGISMLLSKPGGLRPAELNMIQARMLMNSGIPHHLRLQLREIDMQVTLEYALSRRKMLSHLLKGEKLGLSDFFGLLLQIASGMEEGRLYMLQADQYLLQEDYIFIDGPLHGGKVYLTYLPMQAAEGSVSAGRSLTALIMALMASVRELSGDGVQRLLQYCGEEGFTPGGLKELLAELLTEGEGTKWHLDTVRPAPSTFLTEANVPDIERSIQKRSGSLPGVTLRGEEQRRADQSFASVAAEPPKPTPWMSGYPILKLKEEQQQLLADDRDLGSKAAPDTSAYRTYTMLGGVVTDAVLWKFLYMNHPKPLWMVVCVLATIMLGIFCWLVWSGRLILGGTQADEEAGDEIAAKGRRNPKELEWDFGRNNAVSSNKVDTSRAPVPVRKLEPPIHNDVHTSVTKAEWPERSLAKGPVPTPPLFVEATALLQHDSHTRKEQEQGGERTIPYLERIQENAGGIPEKIELNRPSFLIGRSPDVAQYVEKSEGVSRVHAEISKSAGGYILKDLDSRNGTLFQGEAMIPYKEYPLTEGAMFTIVKGCYTFRSA